MFKHQRMLGIGVLFLFTSSLMGCHLRSREDIAAERGFRDALGKISVTVFPACLRDGKSGRHHEAAATELAAFLNSEKLAIAQPTDACVPLSSSAHYSQTRIYAASIAEFRAYLCDNAVTTDYAALPEYLVDRDDRPIGVHVYVLRRDGAEAFGMILNSHHPAYKTVNPRTIDDATRVLIDGLRGELKTAEEKP